MTEFESKNFDNMKLSWQQWTAIGIAGASVIGEIILAYLNPTAAISACIGFVLGGVVLYLAIKKGIVNE